MGGLVGVGRGLGRGVGGVWVTNVMVRPLPSGLDSAVRALGPTWTTYCVLGARLPLTGCT